MEIYGKEVLRMYFTSVALSEEEIKRGGDPRVVKMQCVDKSDTTLTPTEAQEMAEKYLFQGYTMSAYPTLAAWMNGEKNGCLVFSKK